MNGFFYAFRNDGGPTLYTFNNRTPVTGDINIITILVIFSTLLLAFLVIFPGVRKQKISTLVSVLLSLFVGCSILISIYGSSWHVAQSQIISIYKAYSREKISANIGAFVGLDHVNITLKANQSNNWTSDIDFNEIFLWHESTQMGDCYIHAIKRGVPFPILTVAEYFSLNQEGFSWGGKYRAAGYFTSNILWASFSLWLLMNLLLIIVPRYGGYLMALLGLTMIFATYIYYKCIPSKPLMIRFEGGVLDFKFGWCFWLVLLAGICSLIEGMVISIIEFIYPHRFSTILEVDFDTPYDRHVIIEESLDKRYRKKPSNGSNKPISDDANNGVSFGSKILRRLSSKTKNEKLMNGVDNQAFDLTPPKSPWRYPFQRDSLQQRPPKFLPIDRQDSDGSMTSSLGLGNLNRPRDLSFNPTNLNETRIME